MCQGQCLLGQMPFLIVPLSKCLPLSDSDNAKEHSQSHERWGMWQGLKGSRWKRPCPWKGSLATSVGKSLPAQPAQGLFKKQLQGFSAWCPWIINPNKTTSSVSSSARRGPSCQWRSVVRLTQLLREMNQWDSQERRFLPGHWREKELRWTLLRAPDGDVGHLSLLLTRSQDSAVSCWSWLLFSYMEVWDNPFSLSLCPSSCKWLRLWSVWAPEHFLYSLQVTSSVQQISAECTGDSPGAWQPVHVQKTGTGWSL